MKLLTVEPRALLVQGIHDYLCAMSEALRSVEAEAVSMGLTEYRVIEWIVKEQLERVYHLFPINHDSGDWRLRKIYYQIGNQLDLDRLTGECIQVPQLYGDHCFVDLEIRGIDLFMWYYKHDQVAGANYSYRRKWN